ncbi:MAG: sulfotransferase family 2 domain-containing protein [Gemmatimonadota bacterium]|nr:sulfotransferase family 2 domain-containing protein [Gemmatimonadota bacterium]
MLHSRQKGCIFVHIQKTGGETVAHLLERQIPDLERIAAKHERMRNMLPTIRDFDPCFSFCFVRNPWDRLVSWHSMIMGALKIRRRDTRNDWRKRAQYGQARSNPLWLYVYEEGRTFSDFIRRCTKEIEVRPGVRYSFAYNQLDYVTDERGEVLVNRIGRQERLSSDLMEIFERLGLPAVNVPVKNPSRHRNYREYYSDENRRLVAERFARDIEFFDYEF